MEREIYVDNLHTYYKIAGKGQSTLILHGWGSSSNSWIKVQNILVRNGFQVIIPDFPNFGKTASLNEPWNIDDYVNFIIKFSRQLGLNKFSLIGHSFGGRVSIKISAKYPEKIENLILVDSAGIKPELSTKDKTILTLSKITKKISRIKILTPLVKKTKKLFYQTIFRKRDYAKLSGVMRETFKNVINEDLLPYLDKIKIRTLLIWGEKDKSVPIKYAYIFKEKIKNSELKIIPNSGHSPNLDTPERLSQLIINFLTKND